MLRAVPGWATARVASSRPGTAAGERHTPQGGALSRPDADAGGQHVSKPEEIMMDDGTRVIGRPRGARPPATRTAAAVVATASLVLLLAACGGSPSSTGTGGSSTAGGSTNSQSTNSQMLPFASCVRSRGVSNFPDPSGNGKFPSAQQLGVGSSQLSAAENACAHLLPAGTNDQFPAAEMPHILSGMLNFSRCMRSHGVPNWPDPTVNSEGRPYFPVSDVPGLEHDYRLPPQVMTSDGQCHHLLPAGGGMPLG
jgi:hypothetical protein